MAMNFTVNGKASSTDAPLTTPLLWVIREGIGGSILLRSANLVFLNIPAKTARSPHR
ncbi:MAG: hypothetical protein QOD67_3020 [Caballeronia sp.]|nr:hypothetical protein [Caballeronia sp.]